jgi:hypothetical protein
VDGHDARAATNAGLDPRIGTHPLVANSRAPAMSPVADVLLAPLGSGAAPGRLGQRRAVSGASRLPSPPASTIEKIDAISASQGGVDDCLRLFEDPLEVLLALEALGVKLVDILGP